VAPHAFHDRPAHPDPVHVAVADVIGEGIATLGIGPLGRLHDMAGALAQIARRESAA